MKYKKSVIFIISVLAILGLIDSVYLTLKHYEGVVPPCTASVFVDCEVILTSKYSEIYGIPLALLGVFHYGLLSIVSLANIVSKRRLFRYLALILALNGFVSSTYFMYLQLVVIGSICLLCTASALISYTIFALVLNVFPSERKRLFVWMSGIVYCVLRPIVFQTDSENIHNALTVFGENMGRSGSIKKLTSSLMRVDDARLSQRIHKINFENPIGLAAGFDYEARLTQIFPPLGFGFMTVGTVTNMSYKGNPKPRLGRLPKSKSLLVNKGFKSTGADAVSERISKMRFEVPVGVSIGRTNSPKLKTQKQSIKDITAAFIKFEESKVGNSYYELNISCPNLIHGDINFYPPKNLRELLVEVNKLKLKKPVFVKMPIIKTDRETLRMLDVISKYSPVGVIFGNLQMDRNHPKLDPDEVKMFKKGNFSGKPTYERSNQLIELSYKHYKDRFVIVGCGGVFNGSDAYKKIKLGATLVQLISGLIFKGPQLVSSINFQLIDLMKKDGFSKISEVVGVEHE